MAKIRFTIVKTGVTIKDRIRVRRFLKNIIIKGRRKISPNCFEEKKQEIPLVVIKRDLRTK